MHFAQMFQGEPESLTPSWIIRAGPTGTKLSQSFFFFFPLTCQCEILSKKTLLRYIPPTRKILMAPCYQRGVIHLFTEYFLTVYHMPDTAKQHPHCLKVPAQDKDHCGEWSGVGQNLVPKKPLGMCLRMFSLFLLSWKTPMQLLRIMHMSYDTF